MDALLRHDDEADGLQPGTPLGDCGLWANFLRGRYLMPSTKSWTFFAPAGVGKAHFVCGTSADGEPYVEVCIWSQDSSAEEDSGGATASPGATKRARGWNLAAVSGARTSLPQLGAKFNFPHAAHTV